MAGQPELGRLPLEDILGLWAKERAASAEEKSALQAEVSIETHKSSQRNIVLFLTQQQTGEGGASEDRQRFEEAGYAGADECRD